MTTSLVAPSPFRIAVPTRGRLRDFLGRVSARAAERVLGLHRLDELYAGIGATSSLDEFLARALAALECTGAFDPRELEAIPAKGPLLVVANHPFGAVDGLLLAKLLRRVRPDVRILANRLLERIPELRELFFPVEVLSGPSTQNHRPLRDALRWLGTGGALGVFPAGEVSHLQVLRRTVADPEWQPLVARLALASGATVVPVHFEGRNSALFQALGLVHARLRTAWLAREATGSRARAVRIRIGKPIATERLAAAGSDLRAVAYLRLKTYELAAPAARTVPQRTQRRSLAPVVDRPPLPHLCSDLARLPREQWLVDSGAFAVGIARAPQIPDLLREIGRLREITFRAVGEGTGDCTDLDRFDQHYLHLFCWDRAQERLVGAYRLGATDEILPAHGRAGLYTSTLFRLRRDFLKHVTPGLELGRSFVTQEYQRSSNGLPMLWKGIGAFVARHPRYRRLFGPVSVSDRYSALSRRLIVEHLRAHAFDERLAKAVAAKRPFHASALREVDATTASRAVHDLRSLGEFVSASETGARGVPVLVREYLKLGGKMLGFHVDREFGNSLDGLVLVDLLDTEPRLLARHLGAEGAERFLWAWRSAAAGYDAVPSAPALLRTS